MYRCEKCRKRFKRLDNFKIHLLMHSGERQFKCQVCEKGFVHSGHLDRHRLVHTGVKKFSCEECLKTFFRKDHLDVHRRIHTGQFFICEICDQRLTTKSGLTRHVKSVHL